MVSLTVFSLHTYLSSIAQVLISNSDVSLDAEQFGIIFMHYYPYTFNFNIFMNFIHRPYACLQKSTGSEFIFNT